MGIDDGFGDGVSELGDCLCGEVAGPLVLAAIVRGELLDKLDVTSGGVDEASRVQHGARQQSDFLGLRDGGDRREVTAGVSDDDGDARAGQPDGGDGQVATGRRDVLSDDNSGLLVA